MLINDIAVLLQNERKENKAGEEKICMTQNATCSWPLQLAVFFFSSFLSSVKLYYEMMWKEMGRNEKIVTFFIAVLKFFY